MKKKAIEKIPYLTLPKVVRKKGALFVAVTDVKDVAGESHFFLEVYRNTKETRKVPVIRVVCTKKDFGTYWPESETWSRQKIVSSSYSGTCIWEKETHYRTSAEREKKNVLFQDADKERFRTFFKKTKLWKEERWWEYIEKHQDNIVCTERNEARSRKYERRQQALKDRIDHTPELPEQLILDRANQLYFSTKHFLYYKKCGSWIKIACSKCGGVSDVRWKDGVSYESQFQNRIEEPREKRYGKCPLCGEYGKYKCQGRAKGEYSETAHLFLGQKYKETGLVLRYIRVDKTWNLELIAGENGPEMYNALEELSGVEVARTYYEDGKEPQTDYHKHSWYDGKDYWDDCNLYGSANITIGAAYVMRETYEEMKGTIFQYSGMKEYEKYEKATVMMNAKDYLERYQQIPQIEMLVKLNLIGIVNELLKYHCGIITNMNAKRPDAFLGIRKERVKLLAEQKGNVNLLEVMKIEKRMDQNWTEEQIKQISETKLARGQIELATEYMSIQKLLNRIAKYANCEYGTGCSRAEERIRRTAGIYVDYLSMRAAIGYDLRNSVYQQPRDLKTAHDRMVLESNKKEIDKRLEEAALKFPLIRKNYRKLRDIYFYEDEKFLIRPARSAEEIVMEGRILHHCVGGDGYLRKHDSGESYILMIRQQDDRETPYITVEIRADRPSIIQWYGAHDNKPDEKNMQRWLNTYIHRLICGERKNKERTGQEAEEQMLLPAAG